MLPNDAPSFTYDATPGCSLKFDESTRMLSIVHKVVHVHGREEEILDVIDTDDMIGARIEIEMKSAGVASPPTNIVAKESDRDDNEPPTDVLSDGQGSTSLVIFVYPRRTATPWSAWLLGIATDIHRKPTNVRPEKPPRGARVPHHRTLLLEPSEDFGAAKRLVEWLRTIAQGETPGPTPKRYWIIVNPVSGPNKNTAWVAKTKVVPMLEQANIDCTICETTHAKHGQALFKDMDSDSILRYDAIVLMGGDGIIHEVLNGIQERSDSGKLLQHMQKIPIGIVGCGTSNGLATSLTYAAGEESGVIQETFLIAKGRTIEADVASYQIGKKPSSISKYTSFLTFTWAMIADIDIDSECLRFLGESRYDVWGAYRTAFLRTYKATLGYTMNADKDLKVTDPIPSTWTILEADFVLLWASQVTHAGRSTFHCPGYTFGSGTITIMIVRNPISRWKMLGILLALQNGSHAKLPGVEWITCQQFRLIPAREDVSHNDVDGEEVVRGPVQAIVESKRLRYFGVGSRS